MGTYRYGPRRKIHVRGFVSMATPVKRERTRTDGRRRLRREIVRGTVLRRVRGVFLFLPAPFLSHRRNGNGARVEGGRAEWTFPRTFPPCPVGRLAGKPIGFDLSRSRDAGQKERVGGTISDGAAAEERRKRRKKTEINRLRDVDVDVRPLAFCSSAREGFSPTIMNAPHPGP